MTATRCWTRSGPRWTALREIATLSAMGQVPSFTSGNRVHLTGIKGTGMAALAEILVSLGLRVSGSDGAETFFTDEILARIGITPRVGFAAEHVPRDATMLVYSAAYDDSNPERREATRRDLPQFSYTDALGALSRGRPALAVSGSHGKTTTAAILATLVDRCDLDATVVVGSAVPAVGGRATVIGGPSRLIAETCEYRRHFLSFQPDLLVITTVEADHLDYFADAADVERAFLEFASSLSAGGTIVYCADDRGATDVARRAAAERPDLALVPYGFSAGGPFSVAADAPVDGVRRFTVGANEYDLRVPGRHSVLNAAAALAALTRFVALDPADPCVAAALEAFTGSRRRSEIVAEADGVTIVDDYGHHPTEIRTTLAGLREFYPGRRLLLDFMSHTFTRSAAFLDEFATAFGDADTVILNDIYASARETDDRGMSGERFYRAVAAHHPHVIYEPTFAGAAERAVRLLEPGDLFVTMGAGDNFRIARQVADLLAARSGAAAQ